MSAHTPGPWHLVMSDNATPHINHEHGDDWTDIADLKGRVCVMPAEIMQSFNSLANARLIVAAPDLLAALQNLLDRVKDLDDAGPAHEMWQSDGLRADIAASSAAIAKATGEKA